MCLLNAVLEWSAQHIVCDAIGHGALDHPLRAFGRLGAVMGVEYAAQAMAVHGALLASGPARPSPGYLTSVRGLRLSVERLDDVPGPIRVRAERLSGDTRMILYQFGLEHAGVPLLVGRASVVLDA